MCSVLRYTTVISCSITNRSICLCLQGDSDTQASVLKELFRDTQFIQEHSICSVNSINWARIAAQSSYYVWSYLQVVVKGDENNIGKSLPFFHLVCYFLGVVYH
jgi:threonine synthase